jgi:hypothetical protein
MRTRSETSQPCLAAGLDSRRLRGPVLFRPCGADHQTHAEQAAIIIIIIVRVKLESVIPAFGASVFLVLRVDRRLIG